MSKNSLFKWRHYQPEIILLCVRWYLRYPLSYRQLEEMMRERGLGVDHTTIYRWVQKYSPELEKRIRPHLRAVGKSWRVDETYIKIKGSWKYLYRAIDSDGNTIDFMLSATRNKRAAYRFFKKILKNQDSPRVINTDKNPAYPIAIKQLKSEKSLQQTTILRRNKYLNNILEQDHRFIKKRIRPMLNFKSFQTARRTIVGIEIINCLRKGQVESIPRRDILSQVEFINRIFGIVS